jgi:transposase
VRPRKRFDRSLHALQLPASAYDQLAERRFEFIPLGARLPSVHHASRQLSPVRHCRCRKSSLGRRKRTLNKAYMLFLARWARRLSWKETAGAFRTSWDKVFDSVEHVVTFGLGTTLIFRLLLVEL